MSLLVITEPKDYIGYGTCNEKGLQLIIAGLHLTVRHTLAIRTYI